MGGERDSRRTALGKPNNPDRSTALAAFTPAKGNQGLIRVAALAGKSRQAFGLNTQGGGSTFESQRPGAGRGHPSQLTRRLVERPKSATLARIEASTCRRVGSIRVRLSQLTSCCLVQGRCGGAPVSLQRKLFCTHMVTSLLHSRRSVNTGKASACIAAKRTWRSGRLWPYSASSLSGTGPPAASKE